MKRQRREHPREQPLPFAGLQQFSGTEEAISLAVYGVSATLHPISPDLIDDEGSEFVPWPEGSSDPILVDRFDCRLLLDPLDLRAPSSSHRPNPQQQSSAGVGGGALSAEEEAELDEERWRDLRSPPAQQYHFCTEQEQDEDRYNAAGYAAVPFAYENDLDGTEERNTVQSMKHLHPPATPPWLPSDARLLDSVQDSLPFSAVEFAVMTRTAAYLKKNINGGGGDISLESRMADLRQKTQNNIDFAFLSPEHRLYDFFLGLLENLNTIVPPMSLGDQQAEEAQEPESDALGLLVAEYGSGSEQEECTLEESAVDQEQAIRDAIIARTGEAFLNCLGAEQAAELRIKLDENPIFEFLNPESRYFDAFCAELERIGVATEIISSMQGKKETLRQLPRAPLILPSAVLEAVKPAAAVVGNTLPPWILDRMEDPSKESDGNGNTTAAPAGTAEEATATNPIHINNNAAVPKKKREVSPATSLRNKEIEDAKKAERKNKARLLLQRQELLRAEQKQEQAAAQRQAEEERNKHLAAISVHKRMFLSDDDDE